MNPTPIERATPFSPPPRPFRHAWRSPAAWMLFLGITLIGLSTDLASKHLAFKHIGPVPVEISRERVLSTRPLGELIPRHQPVVVIPSVLELTQVLNPGAVFGIGAGKRWFFVVFTGIALALALWAFFHWISAHDRWGHLALGLLVSGGLGNLYDRVAFACVRDFIHPLPGLVYPGGLRMPWSGREIWPYVSNLADLWLLVGIAILLVKFWRAGGRSAASGTIQAPSESTRIEGGPEAPTTT